TLSIYRNICAHNERFYQTRIKVPLDDIFMGFGQKLPNTVDPINRRRLNAAQKRKRMNARQGIYTLIFIISLFVNKEYFIKFLNDINIELETLEGELKTIPIDEIKRYMGMNFDWYNMIKR